MPLFAPRVKGTCACCNGAIHEKDMMAGCSLCGAPTHYACSARNPSGYNPVQIGWFMKVYRLNPVMIQGGHQYSFCPRCQHVLRYQFLPQMIQRMELTARYDELAQLYEDFGYLAESGEVRNRKNRQTVKNINVDVNGLVEQMKNGALNIPYKCTNCGAALTVSSGAGGGGMKYCAYCGTAINTEAMLAVIQQALR